MIRQCICALVAFCLFASTDAQIFAISERRARVSSGFEHVIIDYGRLIVDNCPPMLCTGLDCALVTERNGCQLCACPIGSPARGCDPMPFVLWHDLMVNGCPINGTDVSVRDGSQKVTRWFRRVNRFTGIDECESYVYPYCQEIDYNLWRSPRSKEECEFYCYSFEEQRAKGLTSVLEENLLSNERDSEQRGNRGG